MNQDWFNYDRGKSIIIVLFDDGRKLTITPDNVTYSYFSGGPGGQNVNKNMNGVRITYIIPEEFLHTFQKTRELVARSIAQRSQFQNRLIAFDQLAEKVKRYFYIPPQRKKTHIPYKSKENRLQGKKMRSQLKQDRRKIQY